MVFFFLKIFYFSICLTSNKLYWIEDQLADVFTRFYTSASWHRRVGMGELNRRRLDLNSSLLPKTVHQRSTLTWMIREENQILILDSNQYCKTTNNIDNSLQFLERVSCTISSLLELWSTDEIRAKHIISMTACKFKDSRMFFCISSVNSDLKKNF